MRLREVILKMYDDAGLRSDVPSKTAIRESSHTRSFFLLESIIKDESMDGNVFCFYISVSRCIFCYSVSLLMQKEVLLIECTDCELKFCH